MHKELGECSAEIQILPMHFVVMTYSVFRIDEKQMFINVFLLEISAEGSGI